MTFEELNLSKQVEIDRCCDEYESTLASGEAPVLSEFLSRFAEQQTKEILAEELLRLEVEAARQSNREFSRRSLLESIPAEITQRETLVERVLASATDTIEQPPRSEKRRRYKAAVPRLPGYVFLSLLGRGAFGEVWKATDQTLKRTVAIKTPHNQTLSEHELTRFSKEAQLAARLMHPNIVSVFETVTESDRPYIVTDYVDGRSLDEWSRDRKLSWEAITAFFVQICDGLAHAHENGVIHRDLKPTNILVDQSNHPVIADFGLARGIGDETLTIQGSPLGSPAYMSPEQARGDLARSDERSDLFAIGVMLYELLTGERPFRGQRDAILHQVMHSDPTPPRRLNPKTPIDLETICLKCLSKEPEGRYASAVELKDDLDRYRDGKPIKARPLSYIGRAGLCVKRNPVLSAISGIAGVALLALAIGGPLTANRLANEIEQRQKREYVYDVIVAKQAIDYFNFNRARGILEKYESDPGLQKWRSFEWYYLRHQVSQIDKSKRWEIGNATWDMVVSPNGKWLAISSPEEDAVLLYNLPDLTNPRRITHASVHGLAFHPNSNELATGGEDGVKVWSVLDGSQLLQLPELSTWTLHLAYSADGRYLASCRKSAEIRVWDTEENISFDLVAEGKQFYDVAFSPVSNRLAAASWRHSVDQKTRNGALVVWDVDDGAGVSVSGSVLDYWGRNVAFSPDGDTVAVTTNKGVELWEPSTNTHLRTLPYMGAESASFSPDGHQLASGGLLGSIALWERTDLTDTAGFSTEPMQLVGHSSGVLAIGFGLDGRLCSMGQVTGEIIDWGKPTRNSNVLANHQKDAHRLEVFPDGQCVLSGGRLGNVFLTEISSGKRMNTVKLPGESARKIRMSPNGEQIATLDGERVLLFDAKTLAERDSFTCNDELLDIQFSPDGMTLAVTSAGKIRIVDLSGREQQTFDCEGALRLEFSSDGRFMAVTSGPELICFDLVKEVERYRCKGHTKVIEAIAASSQGLFATCSRDSFVFLWDIETGEQVAKLPTMGNYVLSLAFSPDGKTLATGSMSRLKLWNMDTIEETLLFDQIGPIMDIVFSRDGQKLLTGEFNGKVRVWHAPK